MKTRVQITGAGHVALLALLLGLVAGCPEGREVEDGWRGADTRRPDARSDQRALDATDAARDKTLKADKGSCVHPKVTKSCTGGFCTIVGGCLLLGYPSSQPCWRSWDAPPKEVTLTYSFSLSETEVTQGDFLKAKGTNPSSNTACGSNCPVEMVTWYEAADYCNSLSAAQGLAPCYTCNKAAGSVTCDIAQAYKTGSIHKCPGFRLPTPEEWEYARRAGTKTGYYNGTDGVGCGCEDCSACPDLDPIGWHCGNATDKKTRQAHLKQANDWGLFDMAGNVWEWCHGSYKTSWAIRGGSVENGPRALRAGVGGSASTTTRLADLGFRCARTLP